MKLTFKGCLGIFVGIIFWMIIISAILIAIFRQGVVRTYNAVLVDAANAKIITQSIGSDRLTPEDNDEAKEIGKEEVAGWRNQFPALKDADETQVREMIIILKRHPNWTPCRYDSGVLVALADKGTIDYHFKAKERFLLIGPEVETDKYVPIDVLW